MSPAEALFEGSRMLSRTIRFLPALAGTVTLALIAAGCATRPTVESAWHQPQAALAPYHNVLVIAVSPNSRLRRSFEEALVELLDSASTSAHSAVTIGPAAEPLSRESVTGMVASTGADAVLVTRLVSRKVRLDESDARVGVKTRSPSSLQNPNLVELFTLDYNEYEEPGELTARSTAVLESSLYATRDGQLVYSATITAKFDEGSDDVIGLVTEAIARRLRADGVVR